MPVASPYAVFRAADLVWAQPAAAVAVGPPGGAVPLQAPARRLRKRLAPVGVIQGDLFAAQPA